MSSVVPSTYSITNEVGPCVASNVVDRDDTWVAQGACRHGFLDEARLARGIGDSLGGQDFDRHMPVQARMVGFVDHTHAAFTQLRLDPVVFEGATDHGETARAPSAQRSRGQVRKMESLAMHRP